MSLAGDSSIGYGMIYQQQCFERKLASKGGPLHQSAQLRWRSNQLRRSIPARIAFECFQQDILQNSRSHLVILSMRQSCCPMYTRRRGVRSRISRRIIDKQSIADVGARQSVAVVGGHARIAERTRRRPQGDANQILLGDTHFNQLVGQLFAKGRQFAQPAPERGSGSCQFIRPHPAPPPETGVRSALAHSPRPLPASPAETPSRCRQSALAKVQS